MPDHLLPEDTNDWPDDPFQLLGVEPPVTEQDLKRAYTRLIRRFKPEHFPEQFRRIREAYENAQERLKWFGFYHVVRTDEPEAPAEPLAEPSTPSESGASKPVPSPAPGSEPSDPPLVVEPEASGSPASSPPASEQPAPAESSLPEPSAKVERSRPARPASDPVGDAWKPAVAGNRAEAYTRLIELNRAYEARPDIPLRLYWLLAVEPDLDPERSRHEHLFDALIRSRLAGPAAELYRRELETHAKRALVDPYSRLLEADVSAGSLLGLARQRLSAAGADREWAVMDRDLETLAGRADRFEDSAWLSYLVAVMGYVCFDPMNPVYQRCSRLLSGMRHVELRESWAFDQIEEQQHSAKLWRSARTVPGPVREVVRDSWAAPGFGWKRAMRRAASWAAEDPVAVLFQFLQASREPESQPILVAFQSLLDQLPSPRETPYPPGIVRGLVHEFLAKNYGGISHELRLDLLQMLIREAIDPEELVAACQVDANPGSGYLTGIVRTDPILRLVWRTVHAQC